MSLPVPTLLVTTSSHAPSVDQLTGHIASLLRHNRSGSPVPSGVDA